MVSERHSLLHLITRGKKQPDGIRSLSEKHPREREPRDAARMRPRDRRSITHCIAIRSLMSLPLDEKRDVRARRGNYFMAASSAIGLDSG